MLTPRRFLLFLLTLGGFAVAYLGYSYALGAVDGLPAIPSRFLAEASGQPVIVNPAVPPTELWLRQAFGDDAHEVTDTRQTYLTRFRKRDSGLVVACGAVAPTGTTKVPVTPISLALFGRPSTQPKPGEVQDISTFHADKAILIFDREVKTIQEMNEKANLIGIEMIADPDLPGNAKDERRGRIWITSNQKSGDPADLLLVRTVGPLYYEVPPDDKPFDPEVAQVYTSAPVEVFDRKTLPRPLHATAPMLITVPTAALPRPDDLRRQGAVADILHGLTLPPPTVVADGLKLFLLPTKDNRRGGVGYSGVRELRLCEKVQMNLWVEGGGFPGAGAAKKADDKVPANPKAADASTDPPLALTAAFGGGLDGGAVAERLRRKSLLLIETPGPFRYDLEHATATFDIAPHQPDDNGRNEVTVERLSADDSKDVLTCTKLKLDLNRPDDKDAPPDPKAAGKPAALDSRDGGMSIRKMTASGPRVYLSAAAEQLTAQGTEIIHETDPVTKVTTTTLVGAPVLADRDNSQLVAGDAKNPARVTIASAEPPPGSKAQKQSTVTVNGAGRLEMFDREEGRSTGQASWGTRLLHEKVLLGDLPLDRMTFEGGGTFADTDGQMRLSADKLRLWLMEKAPGTADAPKPQAKGDRAPPAAVPHSLIADGNVDAKSPEMIVRKTDQLTIWFRDIPAPKATEPKAVPPKVPVAVAPPKGPAPVVPLPPIPPVGAEPPAVAANPPKKAPPGEFRLQPVPEPPLAEEPEADPNPIHLSARVVETWVTRYPVPAGAAPPKPEPGARPKPAGQGGLKYELERARCEDRVVVHQDPDPTDPDKPLTGLDIAGWKLNLDHSPKGGLLTVTGTAMDPAEVTFEDSKLFGPVVVIDQPNNSVRVTGRGKLKMLGGADLAGDPERPSNMEITWATEMRFQGAKAFAEFVGSVVATQLTMPDAKPGKNPVARPPAGATVPLETLPPPRDLGEGSPFVKRNTLLGHRLDLTFDRPIYFNQTRKANRTGEKKDGADGKAGRPKLQTATVSTIPDDEVQAASATTLKEVMFIEEEFDPARRNQYVRAQVLRAAQIDFAVRDKNQTLQASGPGELRILQPPKVAAKGAKDEGDSKLTVVEFSQRMSGRDAGGVYKEAKFYGFTRSAQIPTKGMEPSEHLTYKVKWHELPKAATSLDCDDLLTVSQAKPTADAETTQRMVGVGNARFTNKDYVGVGGTVTDDGDKYIFDGTPQRPAQLFARKIGVNNTPSHTAEQIQYRKDGSITTKGSSGGNILNGK